MPLSELIRELNDELERFVWRGQTLPGDMVLLGLGTDVLETAVAIQETAASNLPHKAFANARLAFETAQNLLVLATHEEYLRAGTWAWVYFELKSAGWRVSAARVRDPSLTVDARGFLDARITQMREIWAVYQDDAEGLLTEATATIWDWHRRRRHPDNWLRENMTTRQHRAYELFAGAIGGKAEETASTNEAMYKVLCHETHAHPRLEQFDIRVRDGRDVRVVRRVRPAEEARKPVIGGTEIALMESINALRWHRADRVQGVR